MTKKGLLSLVGAGASAASKDSSEDSSRRSTQEANATLNKQTLQTRVPSAKKLAPMDESSLPTGLVGKFSAMGSSSSVETERASKSSDEDEFADLPSALPKRGILTRGESNGALRRGTPRPQELKKTLSTVKFVLENSGLDQVVEEDLEMV